MLRLFLTLATLGLIFAQNPPPAQQTVIDYSGGTNPIYICIASSATSATTSSISAATNASPVVLTSTAHQLNIESKPTVTISGGTGSWTAINVTTVATIIDANTFSIAVDSTSFGALAGTVTFSTQAPRLNRPIWKIQKFVYDGSGNATSILNAGGGNSSQLCSARTTIAYQ